MYKTTCLKTISKSEELSRDRLRRVQGRTKYLGEMNGRLDVDSFLLNGDPVLIYQNGPKIANILKISMFNKTLNQIDVSLDETQMKDIEFTLKIIDTSMVDGKLYWNGNLFGQEFKCIGENCLPIKPSIDLNPPEGLTKFYFDINLLRDMGVHLQLSRPDINAQQPHSSDQSVVTKKCYQCNKNIPLSNMRAHIAVHILRQELLSPNTCGFCGRDTCTITLKVTSRKGTKRIY